MILKNITIENFRSIQGRLSVPLDASVILIHGTNGVGKTSLLTALEIALTGASTALSRIDPGYKEFLPHHKFGKAKISLTASGFDRDKSDIDIADGQITGTGLLSAVEVNTFNERCYLAQSTLSRLLELYEKQDKKSDSPLTVFVKELLGLTRLDAIIEGTKVVGHIARLKNLVPELADVESRQSNLNKEIKKYEDLLGDKGKDVLAVQEKIRQVLPTISDKNFRNRVERDDLKKQLNVLEQEKKLFTLIETRINLEAHAKQNSESIGSSGAEAIESAAKEQAEAEVAKNSWDLQTGRELFAVLHEARNYFSDLQNIAELRIDSISEKLNSLINKEITRLSQMIEQNDVLKNLRNSTEEKIRQQESRATLIDNQIANIAYNAGGLSKVLSDIMQYVSSDECPVCDRKFGEVSDHSLTEHIASKVSTLQHSAGQLSALSKEKSENTFSISLLKRSLAETLSKFISDEEINNAKIKQANLNSLRERLSRIQTQIEVGVAVNDRLMKSTQKLMGAKSKSEKLVSIRNSINAAYQILFGELPDPSFSTELIIQTALNKVVENEVSIRREVERCNLIVKLLDELASHMQIEDEVLEFLTELKIKKDEIEKALRSFDDMKSLIKRLSKHSSDVRAKIVSQIFNDSLNKTWEDFFIRLAPDENFVPAFALPSSSSAPVEAVLETKYRSGGKGGNPRTMLSAGNLNTAALTLFLSLHFSINTPLPFLIIDDPLQSMDEIHISQFAALLKTISRQLRRQVIIAVHDKSLFDYLAFELYPSSDSDKLYTMQLGRNASGDSVLDTFDSVTYTKDRVAFG